MKKCIVAMALLSLLGGPALSQPLRPRDTTNEAPHFAPFRVQLIDAIADRDAGFFRRRAKDAKLTDGTPLDLDQQFAISDPDSVFWSMLDRMIGLGGSWRPDSEMVVYPSLYANFPTDVNALDHDVVTARDIPVYNSADATSFQVGEVSQEIVWVLQRGDEWSRVRSKSGATGWMESEYLYSPTDYRMGLALVNGVWSIVYLVAGE